MNFDLSKKILFFDFETCCLNLALKNRVWQCGFIITQDYKILDKQCHYIKWNERLEISEDAARITRFNEKEYKEKAIENEKILDLLESYLYNKDYLICGQNLLGFDVYVHNMWRKEFNRKTDYSYLDRLIDSHLLGKAIKLNIPYNRNDDFLIWQYKISSIIAKGCKTRLDILGKEAKIDFDYDNLHRAENDVILNHLVWMKSLRPKLENWLMLA